MPFSCSKYLYSWLRLSKLVDLSFEYMYLSFSNKRKTTLLFPSPLTFLQLPIAVKASPVQKSDRINLDCQTGSDQLGLARIVLGLITSRCSEKEPVLLPRRHGWTREDSFVSLSQSVNRPQIFVGHKLSRQLGLRPGMADDVELINGMQKNFRDN